MERSDSKQHALSNVFVSLFRSIYREMLFLSLMACGSDNIVIGKESCVD